MSSDMAVWVPGEPMTCEQFYRAAAEAGWTLRLMVENGEVALRGDRPLTDGDIFGTDPDEFPEAAKLLAEATTASSIPDFEKLVAEGEIATRCSFFVRSIEDYLAECEGEEELEVAREEVGSLKTATRYHLVCGDADIAEAAFDVFMQQSGAREIEY